MRHGARFQPGPLFLFVALKFCLARARSTHANRFTNIWLVAYQEAQRRMSGKIPSGKNQDDEKLQVKLVVWTMVSGSAPAKKFKEKLEEARKAKAYVVPPEDLSAVTVGAECFAWMQLGPYGLDLKELRPNPTDATDGAMSRSDLAKAKAGKKSQQKHTAQESARLAMQNAGGRAPQDEGDLTEQIVHMQRPSRRCRQHSRCKQKCRRSRSGFSLCEKHCKS